MIAFCYGDDRGTGQGCGSRAISGGVVGLDYRWVPNRGAADRKAAQHPKGIRGKNEKFRPQNYTLEFDRRGNRFCRAGPNRGGIGYVNRLFRGVEIDKRLNRIAAREASKTYAVEV